MGMAEPTRPNYPFLAIPDDETVALREDSLPVCPILAEGEESYKLHFQYTHTMRLLLFDMLTLMNSMENSVWDVIHDEMMDWRDPNWTSMNLPDNKTCEDTVLKSCPCDHQSNADPSK